MRAWMIPQQDSVANTSMLVPQPTDVADLYQVLQRRFNEYVRVTPPENAFPTFLEALFFETDNSR